MTREFTVKIVEEADDQGWDVSLYGKKFDGGIVKTGFSAVHFVPMKEVMDAVDMLIMDMDYEWKKEARKWT